MQVILKKDVQNLGETGDVINVKDGYARNFLVPKNLAEVATEGALKNREKNLARIRVKQEKLHQEALAKAEQIEKIGKLERYFTSDVTVYVTLNVQKDLQKIEVTIPVKGRIIRAEESSTDMYVSIDLVEEIIERQLKKYKTKLTSNIQKDISYFSPEYLADEDLEEEQSGVKIVRTKKFGVKPMDPEEACVQMELLGHSFYMFSNSETDEVNVVYRRKDGTYGLIEPEFD